MITQGGRIFIRQTVHLSLIHVDYSYLGKITYSVAVVCSVLWERNRIDKLRWFEGRLWQERLSVGTGLRRVFERVP